MDGDGPALFLVAACVGRGRGRRRGRRLPSRGKVHGGVGDWGGGGFSGYDVGDQDAFSGGGEGIGGAGVGVGRDGGAGGVGFGDGEET